MPRLPLLLAAASVMLLWSVGAPDIPVLETARGEAADGVDGPPAQSAGGAAEPTGEPQPAILRRPPALLQPADFGFPEAPAGDPGPSAGAQEVTTLLSETFEGAFPGVAWTLLGNPTWDDESVNPYQGNWSGWCAGGGPQGLDPATSNYPNNMEAWMIFGPFSLANAQSASLSFHLWLESEFNYDYVYWMASTNNLEYYGLRLSGNTGGWAGKTLDLSNVYVLGNLLGQPAVWIAIVFQSDYSFTYKGAFVDDILLTRTTATPGPDIDISRTAVTVTCAGGDEQGATAREAEVPAPPVPIVPDDKLIDPEEILQGFANGQARVPVIVNLARPAAAPARVNYADAAALKPLQNAIRTQQDGVLARLPANEHRLRLRFENQPGFSAEVTRQALDRLKNDPEVSSIEPVRTLRPHLSQGIPLMNGSQYRSVYNGSGVAAAICDTGVDYTHPRLGNGSFPNAKVLGGYDFGNNDSDPIPVGEAHGTACAGIAAGDLGTAGDYIGGVAHNARLYALKISPDGAGTAGSDAMIAAWNWCVTHKNDHPDFPILVISTSFGGGRHFALCDSASPGMTAAAQNAVAAGITLVAASGNDGYCDSIIWPACISSVISVGAVYDAAFGNYLPCVDAASCAPKTASGSCLTGYYATDATAPDLVTSYSNSASFLDVLAPSNACYTTDLAGSDGYSGGDYTSGFGGTSAACPYAAGAVAALQSAARAQNGAYLAPAQVRAVLASTGTSIVDPKNGVAKPRVNLAAAIDAATLSGHCLLITNMGDAGLTVSSVTRPAWATLTPAPPYQIAGGSSLQVCVTACEACPGCDLDGTLGFQSDDPDEPLVNVALHVDCPPPGTPAQVQASPPNLCAGQSSALSATSGGGNGVMEWFTGSCGGVKIGEGSSIVVSPAVTTTYYVRARGAPCDAVSDCAAVTVQVGAVPVDLDCDGDVDSQDVSIFNACASGPNVPYADGAACSKADREPDGDIDQADFGILQRCFSGEGQPPAPGCAN